MEELDFTIETLGKPRLPSPLPFSEKDGDYNANFVSDDQHIIYDIECRDGWPVPFSKKRTLELAGPRDKIFFNPPETHAAIVTCGGLCPGLNDVIRAIVMCLWFRYGVRRISGIRYGYRGFLPEFALHIMELNPSVVTDIHKRGGTVLGAARGYGDRTTDIVDSLQRMNINLLFGIGGDGTQNGLLQIWEEIKKRNLEIAVVGIPKTIDNDLSFVQRSFGFQTAVSKAVDAVVTAHVEAFCAVNGIGLVKVMGRQSGFIAAYTALAMNDVNFVLVPEVPFDLDGDNGFLAHLERRLHHRHHAVIVVSEGVGQDLIGEDVGLDAWGLKKLADIGPFLKSKITDYFKKRNFEVTIKYIDPSYIIRATAANSDDSVYCERLGTNAVHAVMAGKSGLLVSLLYDHFVHLPIKVAVSKRNTIDPDGPLWRDVIDATGQPPLMKNI